jgi:hypothetical protein
VLEWLCAVIKTGALDVDPRGPLCQSYKQLEGGGCEIRMPDKLGAIQQLSRMCGWNSPERFIVDAPDPLTQLLQEIRQGRHASHQPVSGNGSIVHYGANRLSRGRT